MIVFLVFCSYEDTYELLGIFSTKELADAARLSILSGGMWEDDAVFVEEWEICTEL